MRTREVVRYVFGIFGVLIALAGHQALLAADCQADPRCKAALDAYLDALRKYTGAADELAMKAVAAAQAGAVIGPSSPPAAGATIKVVSAQYGILGSTQGACDATGYFSSRCEYTVFDKDICLTGEEDISKCKPDTNKKKIQVVVRNPRPFCAVQISRTDLCGGYNPAPIGNRQASITYKCGNEQKKLLLKEGEIAYLRCE